MPAGELLGFAGSTFWGLWKIPHLNAALWQPALGRGEHSPQGFLWLLGSLSGRESLSALEIGQSSLARNSQVLSISNEKTAEPLWATRHTVQPPSH